MPLLIAHRGASGHRPEHTASAYRLAVELGAEAVEPDVVVSRDGVLVVRHENELSGTTDVLDRPEFSDRRVTRVVDGRPASGCFAEDFAWAELATLRSRERLPHLRPGSASFDGVEGLLRLRDVLAIVDGESDAVRRPCSVVVELKHAAHLARAGFDVAALLLAELAAAGWGNRPERLVIESFELGVLDRLRELGVAARLVFLVAEAGVAPDELDRPGSRDSAWYRSDVGLAWLAERVWGLSVPTAVLLAERGAEPTTRLVPRAHARGLRVLTWTLRPENAFLSPSRRSSSREAEWGDWRAEFSEILRSGVDGVFADHPELVAEVREELARERGGARWSAPSPPVTRSAERRPPE